MHLYDRFISETLDEFGNPEKLEFNYPDNYNFGYDVVDEMARIAPEQKAMVWCHPTKETKEFTFKDISVLSSKAASVLKKYGIEKGDTVLVILKRNFEYWYIAPALHKLGAVIIPATHLLTPEDISYRVKTADIKAVIGTGEGSVLSDLLKVKKECDVLKHVFAVSNPIPGTVDFTKEMETASEEFERVDTSVYDPSIIYFTSGTTGYPKPVIHDHTYSISHIVTARYWQNVQENGLHFTVAETGWGKASWGKIYGQWMCGCAVLVYDFDAFSPGNLLKIMSEHKVTSFCAPPTVYRYFVKYGMNKVDLTSLKHITTAGEALNPEIFNKVKEQCGLELHEGFGQTESVLMLANLRGTVPKPGSMGKPTPLYDTLIIDAEGNEVEQGQVGELVVKPFTDRKQHGIFMAYYDDDGLYEHVWRGSVYHTGDTAWVDEDGYYWYVGRADDLIKTRGFRVGPFEVENVLMEHPAVLECAVVGVPDANRGNAIKAIVVLAEGYEPGKELHDSIISETNMKMASYKWINMLEFADEMPKTISGKIRRVELRR